MANATTESGKLPTGKKFKSKEFFAAVEKLREVMLETDPNRFDDDGDTQE